MTVSWLRLGPHWSLDHLAEDLSSAERDTGRTLPDGPPRSEYLMARWLVRRQVSWRTGLPPGLVHVSRRCPHCAGPHGSPWSADLPGTRFSLSHGGSLVALAVHDGGAVGLDVDRVTATQPPNAAARFLCPAERSALQRLPPSRRREAFTRTWVRKEALTKAVGLGLRLPFHQILAADDERRCSLVLLPGHRRPWYVQDAELVPGTVAAVATPARTTAQWMQITPDADHGGRR